MLSGKLQEFVELFFGERRKKLAADEPFAFGLLCAVRHMRGQLHEIIAAGAFHLNVEQKTSL